MLTYGDGVSDVDLSALEKFHVKHGKAVTMTGVVPPGRFGELALDGDRVAEMQEKPTVGDRFINAGFMMMRRDFVDRFVPERADAVMLEREPLAAAATAGEMYLFKHRGFWQCMDTARDWELLNRLWAEGKAPWTI
jgi:glucose-1-phosphate cytidylyltransferase